ncbi:MAG: O-antigen ligase family protein [Pseudomonadota bacterium]
MSSLSTSCVSAPRPDRATPAEFVFLYVAGLLFGTKLANVLLVGPSATTGITGAIETPAMQLVWLGLYAIVGLLVALRYRTSLFLLTRSPLIVFLILLTVLSALWSLEPQTSLRRGMAVIGSSLYAVYIVGRLPFRSIVLLLAAIFGTFVLLSLFVCLFMPEIGIMQPGSGWPGYWQGMKYHKNALGRASAVAAVILFLASTTVRGRARWFCYVSIAVAVLLVIVSRSTTALIVLASTAALGVFAAIYQRSVTASLLTIATGVLGVVTFSVAILLSGGVAALFDLFGKDPTLTGRLPMWDLVFNAIQQKFWLGWGYSAFWRETAMHVREIAAGLQYTPEYSHNGLLETWLHVGVFGVALFVAVWTIALIKAIVFARAYRDHLIALFPLLYIYSFGLSNFTAGR